MDIIAKINENNSFGGNFYTKDVQSDWNITNVIYDSNYLKPIWNGSEWVEGSTQEEIEEYQRSLIPPQVHNHKLRLALIHFGIMPIQIDAAIEAMSDLTMREKLYTLWNYAPMLERADTSLNYMATQFEISQENLDNIFIYANSLK